MAKPRSRPAPRTRRSPTARPSARARAIDLTSHLAGAPALYLLADGRFSTSEAAPPAGTAARPALVAAARWISSRRTSTFERLFADDPSRTERLTAAQADGMLAQVDDALAAAAVTGEAAARDADGAAEVRSACLTILSHHVATVLHDPAWRPIADRAAAAMVRVIDGERGEHARPALRAHGINLLQLRGPALSPADRERARALLATLLRAAPPYDQLPGPWRFAMCSADEFHDGECDLLKTAHGFKEIPLPADFGAPPPGASSPYRVFEAPFPTPDGKPIQIFARPAEPTDENLEMGSPKFVGLLVNRHAQLGSFDLVAATVHVQQRGYKLMMNTQCAGLTTRFAVSRMFPDADLYTSWDSTYFTEEHGKVTSSEGGDCFIAVVEGMAKRETHAQLEDRIRKVQSYHPQSEAVPDYVQFVGPSYPLVVERFNDVNLDGKADLYDGFLDFDLRAIAERLRDSSTPRDPGVAASQISGEAAAGLDWAAGSMDRVTQYSDVWAGLPGSSEKLYSFDAAGFYSHREPPRDVPGSGGQDLGRLPAVCRYAKDRAREGGLNVEVMFHSWLSHAAKEYKRLLVAADAMWRAFDLGYLPSSGLTATPLGRRGAVLLTMAGLLAFPADANGLDGLWAMALDALNFPDISRSMVARCITEKDHDADNYYGGERSLRQLIGADGAKGDLQKMDPVAWAKLAGGDPTIGRARPLKLG